MFSISISKRTHFSILKEKVTELVYDLVRVFKRLYRKTSRALAYAKFGYSNEDYDHGFLLEHIAFKLRRVQKALDNGWGEHSKETKQSLRLAIKLADKIASEQYYYFFRLHDEKWGKLELTREPRSDGMHTSIFSRPNAVTPEEKEQELKEFREAIKKQDSIEARDRRLLFRIIEKYHTLWWD